MSESGDPASSQTDSMAQPDWITNRLVLWLFPLSLALSGLFLPPWRPTVWPLAFFWAGGLCLGNALRCGRVHCSFTGPLYLLTGLTAVSEVLGWLSLSWTWLWIAAAVGTVISFIPEWVGTVYWSDRSA